MQVGITAVGLGSDSDACVESSASAPETDEQNHTRGPL